MTANFHGAYTALENPVQTSVESREDLSAERAVSDFSSVRAEVGRSSWSSAFSWPDPAGVWGK